MTAEHNALLAKYNRDVHFVDIFRLKENRNVTGLPFKGIGKEKCHTLIGRGILTAKELLAYDGGSLAMLPRWRDIVENYYDNIHTKLAVVKRRKDSETEPACSLERWPSASSAPMLQCLE